MVANPYGESLNGLMIFAERVHQLLERDDRNQTDLAAAVGTTQQQVNKWLNAKNPPKATFLIRIAIFFGVSVDWLIRDDVDRPTLGLSKIELEVLSAAKRVGYDLALNRIMNVPGANGELHSGKLVDHSSPDPDPGQGRSRRA